MEVQYIRCRAHNGEGIILTIMCAIITMYMYTYSTCTICMYIQYMYNMYVHVYLAIIVCT